MSEVTLEFGWDAQMSNLSMDVREKLDRLQLPLDADKPIVLRYDPALDPILKLSLTGEMNLSQLRLLADKDIKEKIERIEGVASARVQGGQQEEIHIDINQGKLAVMGISPESLSTLLSDSNINRPGGSLKNTQSQYLVRTLNEYQNLQEMRNLRITQMNQPPVTLGEVAKVSWGEKDREEIVRFNGKEGIMLAIYKEGDANTVEVAQLVKENIQRMQQDPDANFKLTVEFDQSRFIQQSIDEVKSALMMGGFLAILVLWLFLRNIRLTLIVAIAIPISVIATFIFMYRLDISLNIMSLGGLTLGVGMLLDSAIVVLESIHRHREDGQETALAAMDGTGEVGGAVLASVLTTIAVFIPIVFVEGIAGQLFKDQALTITFSLIASLIVAFTLTPMLAGLGKSTASSNPKGKLFANFVDKYKWLLHKALAHPIWLLSSSIVIFVLCLNLGKTLDNQLIPELKEGEFYFDVTLADGASLPATTELLTQMESIALNDPDVARVYLSIGSRNVSGGLSLKNKDENLGQINVVIKDRANRIMEERVINNLRQSYQQFAAADVQFGRPGFFSLKTPVELLFFSENLPLLRQYTLSLLPKLQQIKELIDIRASLESGNPEVKIEFNRNLLAQLDLNIEEVANVLNQRVNGVVVSRFQQP
ncbi:MAG: acriflavin resistance protein, partial [Candidatus Nealsonbacteria bacterium CG15_BIG_FIL_POST_REV_8_21_14_020_37_12]